MGSLKNTVRYILGIHLPAPPSYPLRHLKYHLKETHKALHRTTLGGLGTWVFIIDSYYVNGVPGLGSQAKETSCPGSFKRDIGTYKALISKAILLSAFGFPIGPQYEPLASLKGSELWAPVLKVVSNGNLLMCS